ncbi:MAG: hypothetical protein EHM59_07135 [Betaproteobacteria bacterium]|nr:MAG: hypothetical protein EHM59_07135 [Betaproteobacteria bacterium]
MEQGRHDPESEQVRIDRRARSLPNVSRHDPCHGERDIERMLQIVVRCVAGDIAGIFASKEARRIGDRPCNQRVGPSGIEGMENSPDFGADITRIGRLNAIGDIVIVAPPRHGPHPRASAWL